jgi:hypothetical protein
MVWHICLPLLHHIHNLHLPSTTLEYVDTFVCAYLHTDSRKWVRKWPYNANTCVLHCFSNKNYHYHYPYHHHHHHFHSRHRLHHYFKELRLVPIPVTVCQGWPQCGSFNLSAVWFLTWLTANLCFKRNVNW